MAPDTSPFNAAASSLLANSPVSLVGPIATATTTRSVTCARPVPAIGANVSHVSPVSWRLCHTERKRVNRMKSERAPAATLSGGASTAERLRTLAIFGFVRVAPRNAASNNAIVRAMMVSRRHTAFAALVLTFAGCGTSDDHSQARSAAPTAPDATQPATDPPATSPGTQVATSTLTIDDGVSAVTQWTFDATPLGAHAGVTLFLTNTGTAQTAPLALSIAGSSASEFAVDVVNSACPGQVLAPGARCAVELAFLPTTFGARAAVLHVDGAPATLDLPLAGTAVAQTLGLAVDRSTVDVGVVEVGTHAQAHLRLVNSGTTSLFLGATKPVTGPFTVTDDCSDLLAPGAGCTVRVDVDPPQNGILTGTLTVASSANPVTVQLRAVGARRINVALAGDGRVTSSPAGIDCGAGCTGLFTGGVTLTATPGATSSFTSWTAPCGAAPSCSLPATGPSVTETATFALVPGRLHVTIAGDGQGFVYLTDDEFGFHTIATCRSSCTVDLPAGPDLQLWAFTPSTFAGFTAGCVTSDHSCAVDSTIHDVTVQFDRDPREIATLFPALPVTGLGFAPDGDLILGDRTGVSKLTVSGVVVWTTPIVGGAHDLVIDDAGNIYGASNTARSSTLVGPGLFALSPAGVVLWTRPFNMPLDFERAFKSFQSRVSASPDGTVIAALTDEGVHVVDGAGVDRFPVIAQRFVDGMAVAPDGTVAYGTQSVIAGDIVDVHRVTKDGAPLEPITALFGDRDLAMTYGAGNFLCTQTMSSSVSDAALVAPDLSYAWRVQQGVSASGSFTGGVAFDSSGDCIVAHMTSERALALGVRFDARSPTGAITFTHDKPATDLVAGPLLADGVTPSALAADHDHHIALGGEFGGFGEVPWIQVFEMP